MDGNSTDYPRLARRIAVGMFFFLQGIVFSSWASRIADVKTALGLSDAALGLILLGTPVGQFCTMPFSGYFVSKFGSRKIIRMAAVLYPLALFLMAYAGSAAELFAALAVFGVFANLNNIAINTQAVDVESIYGRSIMSSFHGIWSFAGFFGGIASTLLVAAHINIVGHFAIVNVFTLLILIASYKYLVAVDVSNSSDKEPSGEKPRGFFSPTPFIIFLGMIAFGSMSCEGTMFDWSVVYFKDVVGATPDASRIGFIAFMSTMAMGRFVGDSLITKFGAVRVLQCSGIVIASGMMLAVIFPNAVVAAVGFLMVGAGVSSVVPTCYSLAGHSRRMKTGIAIATVSTIGFLGFLMGPPLIGFVSEISNLRCSFSLMALIGLVVTFVAPRLRNRVN